MRVRPRLFVGTSAEHVSDIGGAIQANLQYDADVTLWSQGIFELSKAALESLLKALDAFDFAAFVLAPDDVLKIRERTHLVARDNVVFEFGLFLGRLGNDRTFFLTPRHGEPIHLPTDLLGITPAKYDSARLESNPQAALGPACFEIREAIKRAGVDPAGYYCSRYRDKVQRAALSPLVADSPFTFEAMLPLVESEIFLAAQNHHHVLVKEAKRAKELLFSFLSQKAERRVRILLCNPGEVEAVHAWSLVTAPQYADDLQKALASLRSWVDEARKQHLQLEAKMTPIVPVSVSFFDPSSDDDGALVLTPNVFEHIAGLRACYYLSRKENREVFLAYFQKLDTAFLRGAPV